MSAVTCKEVATAFIVNMNDSDTIADLKKKIAQQKGEGFAVDVQDFMYDGKVVDENATVGEVGFGSKKCILVMLGREIGPTADKETNEIGISNSILETPAAAGAAISIGAQNFMKTTSNHDAELFVGGQDFAVDNVMKIDNKEEELDMESLISLCHLRHVMQKNPKLMTFIRGSTEKFFEFVEAEPDVGKDGIIPPEQATLELLTILYEVGCTQRDALEHLQRAKDDGAKPVNERTRDLYAVKVLIIVSELKRVSHVNVWKVNELKLALALLITEMTNSDLFKYASTALASFLCNHLVLDSDHDGCVAVTPWISQWQEKVESCEFSECSGILQNLIGELVSRR